MKFKSGDKVITDENQQGVVDFVLDGHFNNVWIKINNKLELWREDGLRHVEQKPDQPELLPCKCCKKLPVFSMHGYECDCFFTGVIKPEQESRILWDCFYGAKKRELKRGDVVYIKATIDDTHIDLDGDIQLLYARYGKTAEDCNSRSVSYNSVITLEELQAMKRASE